MTDKYVLYSAQHGASKAITFASLANLVRAVLEEKNMHVYITNSGKYKLVRMRVEPHPATPNILTGKYLVPVHGSPRLESYDLEDFIERVSQSAQVMHGYRILVEKGDSAND